ncbi:MAG: site-2 protease family protein [Candidatus Borkfalkiaceae bacterium]|nr:site-2 protease family protein [Christensenellaceae bacterium]
MKLTIHPLFFIFGIYFAFTGKVFLFLIFSLTALVHEYGHAASAERLGYRMNKISLMPYGAVVNGAIEGISARDEIAVALSGPFLNLAVCVFFAALWWLVPETYAYTDTIVFSNLSVAALNLVPAYPLDGGRVLCALLSHKLNYKKSLLITRIIGAIFGFSLLGLFVWSVFNTVNFSILFFSSFLIFGALFKGKESAYIKTYVNRSSALIEGVKESKKLIASRDITLKQLLTAVNDKSYFELELVDLKRGVSTILNRSETQKLLSSYMLYNTLGDIAETVKNLK